MMHRVIFRKYHILTVCIIQCDMDKHRSIVNNLNDLYVMTKEKGTRVWGFMLFKVNALMFYWKQC